jgi:SAM-dependent methyltransferase
MLPVRFLDAAGGFQRSAVVRTAVELGVFSRIAESSGTAEELSQRCGTSARGMRVLCDALCVLDLLDKHADRYRLTAEAAFYLDERSPGYLGGALEFLHSEMVLGAYARFTDAVRTGGAPPGQQHSLEPGNPMWVRFARGMMPLMLPAAEVVGRLAKGTRRVLDVAAGHGLFGITILASEPGSAATAVDWAPVLALARENARQAGVESRYRTIEGDATQVDLGSDYDTIVVANFLHLFPAATCRALLRRLREALGANGRLLIVEYVPDATRTAPAAAAWFATMMLATTPDGDAYTKSEYDAMLEAAGLAVSEAVAVPGGGRFVLVSHRMA